MTLTELYDLVGEHAHTKINVVTYSKASPYTAWQSRETQYAAVAFTVERITNNEEYQSVECILYYGDRLMQDGSNWIDLQDAGLATLTAIINDLREDDGILDVESGYSVDFWNHGLSDYLAGAYVRFNIDLPLDNCITME